MADGSVTFSTKLDNAQLEKDLAKATKKIEALEKKLAETQQKRDSANEQSVFGAAELDAEKAKLEQMKVNLQEIRDIANNTTLTPDVRAKAKAKIPIVQAEITEQQQRVNALQNEWNKVTGSVERYDSQIAEITGELDRQKTKAGALAEQLDAANSAAGKMGQAVDQAGAFLDKFTNRVKKLAARIFVFTLITTALRNMRTWMGKAIKTNGEATAAIARLKGALLTLAQPLLEVVIPAFTMLIKVLTAIIGAIAQFISLLTGKSVKQTAASAKALYDEQSALESVGSAAEDAAGSLAGFDEINTIQTEDIGGGGGGGDSGVEIEPDFSWMDGLSERLKEIADLILLIGAGLALWKIGQMLPGVLGQIATVLGGILMTVGGLLLFWNGLTDAWENGVDWLNLIEMIGGLAAAAFGLYTIFSVLAPALAPIVAGIALVVGGIAMLVTAFHDAMENGWNLQNTLLSIAGIVATGLGFAFITGSVIPLVIAGIAALLLAFTVATGHGEELLEGIRLILEGFVDFFTGIFSGDIEKAIDGISKIFSGLGLAIDSVILGIRDTFLSFLTWLDEKTGGKLHGIIEFTKQLFFGGFDFIRQTVSGVFSALELIFSGLIQFISGVFTGDWNKAWDGLLNIFKGIWNGIVSVLEGAVNLIIDGINWMISQLNKISFDVPDWVPLIGGKKFGFNIPSIGRISIPRLAQGAVIPPNREFLAVLGDQKSGTNIETPLSTMKQAFLEAMQENGGMGGGDIHITVELDGRVVARQTVKHINDMTRQAGKPVLLY